LLIAIYCFRLIPILVYKENIMAKTNKKKRVPEILTHGGAVAQTTSFPNQLRRSVLSCLLWEDVHYESGESVTNRIASLVPKVDPNIVAELALEARNQIYLRHVPLFLMKELARYTSGNLKKTGYKYQFPNVGSLISEYLPQVIQRADEMAEFLSLYWEGGKCPISSSIKRGLAASFSKFDKYQLAKYKGIKNNICMRDVMFLTHPKPNGYLEEVLWQNVAENTLKAPDTWETNLSAGKDKKETWIRLIMEKKLGGLAILRNLRNMVESGVSDAYIKRAILDGNFNKVLPFRFIKAHEYAPRFVDELEVAMNKALIDVPILRGTTLFVVDRSGSMHTKFSGKSELSRQEAAVALTMMGTSICEKSLVWATAGDDEKIIHSTKKIFSRGFKMIDDFKEVDIGGGGIFLVQVLDFIDKIMHNREVIDRVIVITDEQDCDKNNDPKNAKVLGLNNYLINVSVEKNGISYRDNWEHIDGFSENIFRYIFECERNYGFNLVEKWN
jgi:hypothetical protein